MVMVMTICFRFSRHLCDLPRPPVTWMLLYIQRLKPSSSIPPMIRMPRMLQQLVEFPAECSMPQSIAGPRKCCTIKIKCHPRSVSYPSREAAPPSVPLQGSPVSRGRSSFGIAGARQEIYRRQAIFGAPNGSATSRELSPY